MSDADIIANCSANFIVGVPTSASPPGQTPPDWESYLRLGQSNNNDESALSQGQSFPDGVLIYSTDSVQLVGPTFNQWSGDSLSVVLDDKTVMSANYRMGGGGGASATYQVGAAMNTTIGTITNLITGNSITQWLGNDASTGLGSLLWSNYGTTQNVFGGQNVNIINSNIDVQGWGDTKIVNTTTTTATSNILLCVSPAAVAGGVPATAVTSKMALVAGIVSTIAEVMMDIVDDSVVAGVGSRDDSNAMQAAMKASIGLVTTASAAVLVIQAMTIAAGQIAKAAAAGAEASAIAGIRISPAGVLIAAGVTKLFVSEGTISSTSVVANQDVVQNLFNGV